jgi:predicted dehydrogenase
MSMQTNPERTTKVNVAVVGLGFMGVTHLRVYQQLPAVRIAAVCDAVRLPVNGVLAGVAGNVKKSDDVLLGTGVKVYRNVEEVFGDPEIEVVDLCTPTPLHAEQAIAGLKAGKHVLCEKPLARTSAQAREIMSVAQGARGFLMPAMCMRFWPGWSWLKEVVGRRTYGAVLAASFRRLSEMPTWSKQGTYSGGTDLGGALFDLHIHDTDFVQFLFGRPASVFSRGVKGEGGTITHVLTQYDYPGGPLVSAEGSWLLAGGFNMAYTILCERATLDFDLARGEQALKVSEKGQSPRSVSFEGPDGYGGEIRYFIECVTASKPPVIVTAQDGMNALEVCEAEQKSVETGATERIG